MFAIFGLCPLVKPGLPEIPFLHQELLQRIAIAFADNHYPIKDSFEEVFLGVYPEWFNRRPRRFQGVDRVGVLLEFIG